MPDLTIEYIRTCAANLYWTKTVTGSKGKPYVVRFGPVSGGQCSHGWTCDCDGFRFRKTCRHIEAAKAEKCDWNWEAFMGSHADTNPDGTCPRCGGPTEVLKVAV